MSTETLEKPLSKSVHFQISKTSPNKTKTERIELPRIHSLNRITIDPGINTVKKLNMNETPNIIFKREDYLERKKVLIDNNKEIQKKRLGTFKPLSKAEQAQKLENKITERELEKGFKEKFIKFEKKHNDLLLIENTIERIIKDTNNINLEIDILQNFQNDLDRKLVLDDSETNNPEKKFLKTKKDIKFEMKKKKNKKKKKIKNSK